MSWVGENCNQENKKFLSSRNSISLGLGVGMKAMKSWRVEEYIFLYHLNLEIRFTLYLSMFALFN